MRDLGTTQIWCFMMLINSSLPPPHPSYFRASPSISNDASPHRSMPPEAGSRPRQQRPPGGPGCTSPPSARPLRCRSSVDSVPVDRHRWPAGATCSVCLVLSAGVLGARYYVVHGLCGLCGRVVLGAVCYVLCVVCVVCDLYDWCYT